MGIAKKPAFEDADDNVAVAPAAEAPAAAAAVNPAPEAASQAKPPAAATTTALSKPAAPFRNIFDQFANAVPIVRLGTLPRMKASNGRMMDEDGKTQGSWADITIVSYNPVWKISPGADGDEAAQLLRVSYDGKTIDGTGQSISDYIKFLNGEGYKDAASKEYYDLVALIEDSDKNDGGKVGELVQFQLSPQSVQKFLGYCFQYSIKVARGVLSESDAGSVRVEVGVRTLRGKDFSFFDFKKKPA